MIPAAAVALLNKVEPGWYIFAHMVPTRIFRVIADETFRTFRVEQLVVTNRDRQNPRGSWHLLSTHGGETAGAMCGRAMEAGFVAQKRFGEKMTKKLSER